MVSHHYRLDRRHNFKTRLSLDDFLRLTHCQSSTSTHPAFVAFFCCTVDVYISGETRLIGGTFPGILFFAANLEQLALR